MKSVLEIKSYGFDVVIESGHIAKFADGSVLYRDGKNVLLATVVSERQEKDMDFLPLTVQYMEKSYAAGKFPGGFIKRESKPSEFETLTSRIVDRSLRPLFPKGYGYETQIIVTTLSVDKGADLQTLALNAASSALFISDLPIEKFICGVRVGKIGDSLIINPSVEELENSSLDLFVSGSCEEILMIEMRCKSTSEVVTTMPILPYGDVPLSPDVLIEYKSNEIGEDELLLAIKFAVDAIKEASEKFTYELSKIKKPTREYKLKTIIEDEGLISYIKDNYSSRLADAINELSKSERSSAIKDIVNEIVADEFVKEKGYSDELVEFTAEKIKRSILRRQILDTKRRPDGRGLKDIRPIEIETNILPCTHGSCLFTRGQTQALAVVTLGSDSDRQSYELLNEGGSKAERFMLHYNFPGFSVGETSRIGAPGRRELGHGNLAKRAIEPILPNDFDHTIRVVSEILESNGSSSMATICGGSLALKAAGVPMPKLIAGVAMGLIKEDDEYVVLSDIIGLEDFDGDMDFKVAGTSDGVTAMQMDIKLGGLDFELLKNTLYQAKEGREHILNIMQKAESEIVVNESVLPSSEIFHVDVSKIVEIIGQAGKTIKEIIEKFEVAIDLDREKGKVKVTGKDKLKVEGAKEHIMSIVNSSSGGRGGRGGNFEKKNYVKYEDGTIVNGVIKKITDFGAFVELPDGQEGLMHISKVAKERVNSVKEHFNEGDSLEVKILSTAKGRLELANAAVF